MNSIEKIKTYEVLDSRGIATVRVKLLDKLGNEGTFTVPSGASTGKREALELRDKNSNYYQGKGVKEAIKNIQTKLKPLILNFPLSQQRALDKLLIKTDGTENKSNLGANAILAVSGAYMVLSAKAKKNELFYQLGGEFAEDLPIPLINVINGGMHASNNLNFQEFMIIPSSFTTFSEAIERSSSVFYYLKSILIRQGKEVGLGDEGGFNSYFENNEEALRTLTEAIKQSGCSTTDFKIALDCAASEFYFPERKAYKIYKNKDIFLNTNEMINYLSRLVEQFPIVSIEDPLSEEDKEGWKLLMKHPVLNKIQIVGDDIFVTNPKLLEEGIKDKLANSILIKPNQIGTISETLETIRIAKRAGWKVVISHRSGETGDTFISDFSVGVGGDRIKTGSVNRGERTEKYNRLIEIETDYKLRLKKF